MLSKILKVMLIVILLPIFGTCAVMTIGSGAAVVGGVAVGYEAAKADAELKKIQELEKTDSLGPFIAPLPPEFEALAEEAE